MERSHTVKLTLSSLRDHAAIADQRGDGPGTIAWRQCMAGERGQAIYRRRFATERPHAHMRNHGLRRLLVRGIDKVKAVVLWHVHAFNFLQVKRLGFA